MATPNPGLKTYCRICSRHVSEVNDHDGAAHDAYVANLPAEVQADEREALAPTTLGRIADAIGCDVFDPAVDRVWELFNEDRAVERADLLDAAARLIASLDKGDGPEYDNVRACLRIVNDLRAADAEGSGR